MPAVTNPGRPRLSRELVLRGAVAVADAGGIGALTMRSLADALEVKPMSIYHHVANKDDVLDGIVDMRLQRDRTAGDRRRLAVGDAAAGRLRPGDDAASSLGNRPRARREQAPDRRR